MNAGRVEGAIETCVLVGKFIGVLKEFQSPTFMIISFVCLKSNKTHIFCFLTAPQWYLLWGSFCYKFVCWDLHKTWGGFSLLHPTAAATTASLYSTNPKVSYSSRSICSVLSSPIRTLENCLIPNISWRYCFLPIEIATTTTTSRPVFFCKHS